MEMPAVDATPPLSISRRFAVTLAAQISRSGFSFLSGVVVARGLGPVEYGDVAFLLTSFAGLRLLLDMSTSSAFFTFTSQKPRSKAFYLHYGLWVAAFEVGLPLLLIVVLLPDNIVSVLWQHQARDRVWLAFLASTFQYLLWPQVIQLGEVARRTRITQSLTIVISIGQFAIIVLLQLTGLLTVPLFLIVTTLSFVAGAAAAFLQMPRLWDPDAPSESLRATFYEFFAFCKPLIISYLFQAMNGWVEAWLIQHFAGAKQQAYYSLGIQISLIGMLATTALQNIFWREMAELEHKGNDDAVHASYVKTSRVLFFAAALPIVFLVTWVPEVVRIALGSAYRDGVPALTVLFFYPLTQCLYTLAFIIFSVMRRTKALAFFNSAIAICNTVAAFFILSPPNAAVPGLGAGATAMAVKIVVLAFVQVAILEWWVGRLRGWRSDWTHRAIVFGIMAVLSAVVRVIGWLIALVLPATLALFVSSVLFVALMAMVVYSRPGLAGLSAEKRDVYLARIRSWFSRTGVDNRSSPASTPYDHRGRS